MPVFDPDKSKIKMVVLTKGKHANITWYSPLDKNGQSSDRLVKNMLRRFGNYLRKNPQISDTINVINFYENGNQIATARP